MGARHMLYAQKSQVKAISERLGIMLKLHQADTLKSLLSRGFSVGAYSLPSAMNCLNSIASRLDYDGVQVKQDGPGDGGKLLRIRFSKKGKKDLSGRIALDDSGKIVYIDVFDKLYGMDRNAHSSLVAEVPFETDKNGSVILSVKLNNSDRVLKLLFDTGADGMALSKELADSLGIKTDVKRSTSVVGGHMDIEISRNNTVHLGALSLPHQSIAVFKKVDSYDGIIGNSIVKSYITEVNYDRQAMLFYRFGDFDLNSHLQHKGQLVDVTLPEGLIIIPGSLSVTKGKPYKGDFVFDLGAAYSLICFRPFVRHNRLLVDGFKPAYAGSTTSLGRTTPTFTGSAESFHFGSMPEIKGLSVTLMSGGGQSESWNPGFDGSIGSRLISKYNFIIDMQAKKIGFTPNKSLDYPKDFIHAGMLLGFAPDGQLYLRQYTGQLPPDGGLKEGALILSINGIAADRLCSDPGILQQLLEGTTERKWRIQYRGGAQEGIIDV